MSRQLLVLTSYIVLLLAALVFLAMLDVRVSFEVGKHEIVNSNGYVFIGSGPWPAPVNPRVPGLGNPMSPLRRLLAMGENIDSVLSSLESRYKASRKSAFVYEQLEFSKPAFTIRVLALWPLALLLAMIWIAMRILIWRRRQNAVADDV